MSDGSSFADYAIWEFLIQIGFLFVVLILANIMRRKIKFLRNSLLPSSVIGGLIALLINFTLQMTLPEESNFIKTNVMEAITYHTLGLGFISLALKINYNKSEKSNKSAVLDTGTIVVSTYLLQGILGLGLTLVMAYTFLPGLFKASGLILPLGFGQGPGQALNFGGIYEDLGFEGGKSFGLSVAAIGFLFACIGGVIYLNILRKRGKFTKPTAETSDAVTSDEKISAPNELPLSESVDKFTVQLALVFGIYLATYLFMLAIQKITDTGVLGTFGTETLSPLIWGFNFLIGTIFAFIVGKIMATLRKKKVMNRVYPSNYLLNRFGGAMFDLMILAGICAIDLRRMATNVIPLAVICIIGGFATFFYVFKICKKCFPTYPLEAAMSLYGMLTGTASTGMILLREVDPDFKTPAANNLVMQSVPAIILGFPMLLLLGLAPKGTWQIFVTFGALIVLFVLMHVLLFRSSIFKRKKKNLVQAADNETNEIKEVNEKLKE